MSAAKRLDERLGQVEIRLNAMRVQLKALLLAESESASSELASSELVSSEPSSASSLPTIPSRFVSKPIVDLISLNSEEDQIPFKLPQIPKSAKQETTVDANGSGTATISSSASASASAPVPPPPPPPLDLELAVVSQTHQATASSMHPTPPTPPQVSKPAMIPRNRQGTPVPPPPPPPLPPPPPQNSKLDGIPQAEQGPLPAPPLPPPPPPPPPPPLQSSCSEPLGLIDETPPSDEAPDDTKKSRIEQKLDAMHAALATALSLLQSQPSSSSHIMPSALAGASTATPKRKPKPQEAAKVFDARQAMLDELKKRIAGRQQRADAGAITNYS